jgi:hypothetical protein
MKRKNLVCTAAVVGLAAVAGMTGAVAGNAAPADHKTLKSFFIRDTSQASIDLGATGAGHGDLFTYHGNVFNTKGGKVIGRFGGSCDVLGKSTGVPEDWSCSLDYILPGGQLYTRAIGEAAVLFNGKKFDFGIVGGTGAYSNAKGEGTMRIPTDIKDQTDAFITLNVK